MHPRLLEILVCPVTKQGVTRLSDERLALINQKIRDGQLRANDGTHLQDALQAAVITRNQQTIYPVVDQIPIMLESRGIATSQIEDWR